MTDSGEVTPTSPVEGWPRRRLAVVLPEAPQLTPAAAAVLLRMLITADRRRQERRPGDEEERRAA